MAQPATIGVDLGAHSIKIAQVKMSPQGPVLTALGLVPLAELAHEEEGRSRNAKIGLLLRDLLRTARARGRYVVTSLPGRRLFFRYVHVPPVPAWRLKALMEYEIKEEDEDSRNRAAYDFRLLDLPSKATEFTVLVTMAKNEVTQGAVQVVREAGLRVQDIYPGTVSLYNAFRAVFPGEIEETSLLLNIGADSSDMVFQSQGRFYFARNLTNAGNTFTEALLDELQIPFDEAEKLKVQRGRILPVDFKADEAASRTDEVRISDALSNAADSIANAIQTSLMYCRAQLKLADIKPTRLHLCGGGAQIPGLAEYLGTRLRMEVLPLNPAPLLDIASLPKPQTHLLQEQPGSFTTAIGLALTALHSQPGLVTLSLLPEKEKRRRNFHQSDKFLWFAAASLLIALGLSFHASRQMAQQLGQKQTQLNQLLEKAKEQKKEMEERRGVLDRSVGKVDALVLRATSSREIFDLLTLLTNPAILPREINLTEIKVQPAQPVAFHVETQGPLESPAERIVLIAGLVRTVMPPPLDLEKARQGEKPPMPAENYKQGLEVIKNFAKALESQKEIIYKAKLTRANTDPEREKKGEALIFGLSVELAPKTVEASEVLAELTSRSEASRREAQP